MATEVSIMAVIRAARPQFRGNFDKTAFAVHAAFVSAGYVLHATGLPAFTDDALSRTSTDDEVGMDKWNGFGDNYAFVYSNPYKDSKTVLVKCFSMGPYLVVDALKEGEASQLLHLQLNASEYVDENGGTNYGSKFKNLGKLVIKLNTEILNKLDAAPPASASASASAADSRFAHDTPSAPHFPSWDVPTEETHFLFDTHTEKKQVSLADTEEDGVLFCHYFAR